MKFRRQTSVLPPTAAAVAEARFGLRVAAALSEQGNALPHDLSERLKFARHQALKRRLQPARVTAAAAAPALQPQGRTLALFGGGGGGWMRFASLLPLVALVVGLVAIQHQHSSAQIREAADIDAELLGDDLPPDAYRDAGFVEFLKTPQE